MRKSPSRFVHADERKHHIRAGVVREAAGTAPSCSPSLQELEKTNSLLDIEVSRARAERDGAVAGRAALAEELDRLKRQQGADSSRLRPPVSIQRSAMLLHRHCAESSQSNLMTTMDNFNRNQALHIERERDLSRQVDAAMERIAAITVRARQLEHTFAEGLHSRLTRCAVYDACRLIAMLCASQSRRSGWTSASLVRARRNSRMNWN